MVVLSKKMGAESSNSHNFFQERRSLLVAGGATTLLSLGASRLWSPRAELTSSSRNALDGTEAFPTFEITPEIQEVRNQYAAKPLWHSNTVALFGDDIKDGRPVFETPRAVEAIRDQNRNAFVASSFISARGSNNEAAFDGATFAKEVVLQRIREFDREPLTLVLSAHGGENGILVGQSQSLSGELIPTYIRADELAAAFAAKYKSMTARLNARATPDILALVNCASGSFAENFATSLINTEIEQEPERFQYAFKPTIPITFAASTSSEISYINQLLFRMTEHTTVGEMYEYTDRIDAGGRAHSNPSIRVPDPETGEPVIIG